MPWLVLAFWDRLGQSQTCILECGRPALRDPDAVANVQGILLQMFAVTGKLSASEYMTEKKNGEWKYGVSFRVKYI